MARVRCRKILPLALLAGYPAAGQELAPVGIIRGELLELPGSASKGDLIYRNADHRVFQCSFDDHTYFEHGDRTISAALTHKGDLVEVVSDRLPGSSACYARIVTVVDPPGRLLPGAGPRRHTAPSSDLFAPRGNLTFSGVVLKVAPQELLLRTRSHARKLLLLRPDTRYLGDGKAMDPSGLQVNTLVFVRAGKDLDGRIEAYQVIWGDILQPMIEPSNDQPQN